MAIEEKALVTVSSKALALRAKKEELLAKVNQQATEGLFAGAPPMITLSGTRFVIQENGDKRVLDSTKIGVVVLRAKGPFDKAFYLGAYNPKEEAKAPDCFSKDGVRPDPSCAEKQHTACAGCPRNAFGTGKDQDGNPTGGKACSDNKILAVTAGERTEKGTLKVYQFKIPPASLGVWNKYVRTLNDHGVYLPEVSTVIGFDPAETFPKLTFSMGATVADDMLELVYDALESKEVLDIIKEKADEEVKAVVAEEVAPAIAEVPARVATPEPEVAESVGFGSVSLTSSEPAKAGKKAAKKADLKVAEKPAEKAIEMEVVEDDKPEEAPDATKAFGSGLGMPSDDDLRSKLGL